MTIVTHIFTLEDGGVQEGGATPKLLMLADNDGNPLEVSVPDGVSIRSAVADKMREIGNDEPISEDAIRLTGADLDNAPVMYVSVILSRKKGLYEGGTLGDLIAVDANKSTVPSVQASLRFLRQQLENKVDVALQLIGAYPSEVFAISDLRLAYLAFFLGYAVVEPSNFRRKMLKTGAIVVADRQATNYANSRVAGYRVNESTGGVIVPGFSFRAFEETR